MKLQTIISAAFLLSVLAVSSFAQRASVTVTLNEQFFDALLDAAYQNAAPPEFSLSSTGPKSASQIVPAAFDSKAEACNESITVLRENKNVRTGVRFRDGKIMAPLAFTGRYNPPLLGCMDFSGSADTLVTLEFDPARKSLRGYAKVTNVALDGTGGIGGSLVARMVQGSIDRKINPIPIIDLEKISFMVPIQNSGRMAMKAVGFRSEVVGNALNVTVEFEFVKAA